MAHRGKLATKRIVHADDLSGNHEAGGTLLGAGDVLAHDGRKWIVIKEGGTFHLRLADGNDADGYVFFVQDSYGEVHRPIHKSCKYEDIEGAPYAWDDGTAWHFAHCSPGEQLDLAAEAEAFAVQQFAEAIQAATAEAALADINQARNTNHARAKALINFARVVGRRVHEVVVGETLGHFHRNPHQDHKRDLTVAAIRRQVGVLKQNSAADIGSRHMHGRVSEAGKAIVARLTESPTIETRAARVQRFYRLSARGEDPLGGREYIYTSNVSGDAITGAANLPLATWPFDKKELKEGITRGAHVYYDGYPLTLGPNRPFAVRFHRPASGGAWTQETAIRIYGGFSND